LEEWTNLIKLKEESLIRKIAAHEEDKAQIAAIFERINQAREQLVVRICCHFSALIVLFICLGGDWS
jgi:ribonuclease I